MGWGKIALASFLYFIGSPGQVLASQIDSDAYFRLQLGMSEGEVLARAGSPDKEVYLGTLAENANESIRQLLYIPELNESDPYLTVITVQRGKVINIERTKIF